MTKLTAVALALIIGAARCGPIPPTYLEELKHASTSPTTVTEPTTITNPSKATMQEEDATMAVTVPEPITTTVRCTCFEIENEAINPENEPVEELFCGPYPVDVKSLTIAIEDGDELEAEIVDGEAVVQRVIKPAADASVAGGTMSSDAGITLDGLVSDVAPSGKMLGKILVVRIPLDGEEPFHSTEQIRTALYGSADEEEVPKFRRTTAGNTLEVFCESALMADDKCKGMMTKVTVRDMPTSFDSGHFKRSFGDERLQGYRKDQYSTGAKLSFWFERMLKETGEWDQYDHVISIYPARSGHNKAYYWNGVIVMARTQDTWTTYAHELGHAVGLPHASAPLGHHKMYAYGDEALMGQRQGKTDLNAAARLQLGWIQDDAVLKTTKSPVGILKPLNVAETAFEPGLVLTHDCPECWSTRITSANGQDKPGKKGGQLVVSFRVGRSEGGDNNDFGIVDNDLVNKVHLHFTLDQKGASDGQIQRWAALAEGEVKVWNEGENYNGHDLGALAVCKIVVTSDLTEDYAAVAIGANEADARSKCAPWRDEFPETLSIAGSPSYHTSHNSRGEYKKVDGLTHTGAPVYRGVRNNAWSLYKRSNGMWYLDFNAIDDTWSGTVNYALAACATPFECKWNSDMVVAHSTVTIVGKPSYQKVTEGVYHLDLTRTYGTARKPVYQRKKCGYSQCTWSFYMRNNKKWFLDYTEVDETWSGTVSYSRNKVDTPFDANFDDAMKVLRGSWGPDDGGSARRLQGSDAATSVSRSLARPVDARASPPLASAHLTRQAISLVREKSQDHDAALVEVPEPTA